MTEEELDAVTIIASGVCGDSMGWALYGNGRMMITGTGNMTVFDSAADAPWAEYVEEITAIEVEEGIANLSAHAFSGMDHLEEVSLPSTLEALPEAVFQDCTALTEVNIPENVQTIGKNAFADCSALETVRFEGDAPASVADTAFAGVNANVYVPEGNDTWTEEKQSDFGGSLSWDVSDKELITGTCGVNLTWSFDRNARILTISGTGPMADFTLNGTGYSATASDAPWQDIQSGIRGSIKGIVIEKGVTTVGRGAFVGMESVIVVSLPDTLTSIGDYAFSMNTSLKELDIPAGVTYLGDYALFCCPNLVSVTLPAGIMEIGTSVFDQTWPSKLAVPVSVKTVGSKAFAYGTTDEIIFTGNAPAFAEDAFHNRTTIVRYPENNDTWENVIKKNFSGNIIWLTPDQALPEVDLGSPIYKAASGTWGSNITWTLKDNGVLTISGSGAMVHFRDVPNSGFNYPWNAYSDSITEVIICEGITELNQNAFSDMKYVTKVTLPDSLTNMSTGVFGGCVSLKNVVLGSGVTEIGEGTFMKCTALEKIEIPSNVRMIGGHAFDGCKNLKNVTISEGVTVIWKQAFRGCTSLISIDLPDSLGSIGISAFESCTGLKEITLPANLWTMYHHVFYNCTNLKKLYFEGNHPDILPYALLNLTATAYYPANNPTWTSDVLKNYGGNITWMSYNGGTTPAVGIPVDKANFPDENFRAWILVQDYGADGWLTPEEIAAVSSIYVPDMGIADLTGIEHFTALIYLDCGSNLLGKLDVSRNTALETLQCYGNQISVLDLQNNVNLKFLNCNNNKLTALKVDHLLQLENLSVDNNQLSMLDVTKNTALDYLGCSINRLNSLDISKNTVLRVLHCFGNQIADLDVSNQPNLEYLTCGGNQLTTLDVSKNTKLNMLNCSENKLTSLSLHNNTLIEGLECGFNQLTKLDVSKNVALTSLSCVENQLTELDVTSNTKLKHLDCGGNKITNLDVSQNTRLYILGFSGNQLTEIDVRNNTLLNHINCSTNQLTSLDLSGNPQCTEVYAIGNCRQIKLNNKNEFDLSTLPGFDVAKASNWKGGTVDNGILTVTNRTVTYSYQINSSKSVTFTLQANNHDPNAGKMEGKWGNLSWKIDDSGNLVISGTGVMLHYKDPNGNSDSSEAPVDGYPWHRYQDMITAVIVEEGVTSLAEIAFHGLDNLQSVNLPGSLITIGDAAFAYCPKLEKICIPQNVSNIGKSVFIGSDRVCDITFTGNAPTFDAKTFEGVTATAYYPAWNETWTEDKLDNYGGNITWVALADGNDIILGSGELDDCTSAWFDGVEYSITSDGTNVYVDLPAGVVPSTMITYGYHAGENNDIHTQYPVSMKVWMLEKNEDGSYKATRIEELDDILQYNGTSIRITGKKGIRMITAVPRAKKEALTSSGLAGFKLLEYGTVLAQSGKMDGPLVLGKSYARSNYAYKRGVADPVFAYSGNLVQYTNVLVGFSLADCKEDITMRPYMILEDAAGKQITLYGGIVYRSIGYVAYQNRSVFTPGSAAYDYVWEIIHHVYGNKYDADYKG